MSWMLKPSAFIIAPHIGGIAGSFITRDSVKTWYKDIKKAPWTPPNWVFGPVWTSLYTGMGYASYLVYRDGGGFEGEASTALQLYAGHLALNWLWTPLFFGKKKFGLAAIEILFLAGSIVGCAVKFYPINKTASYIMLPYLAWACYASTLNIYIWLKN
ncbi:translocator protein-like [Tubulanus polymorphus]|uniref:translocator protein-like n=1 Tax=Tubulanus polymorphus TaxID=672921 RepID=UPI003DA33BAF